MPKRKHVHAWTRTSSHTFGLVTRYRCTSCPATKEEQKAHRGTDGGVPASVVEFNHAADEMQPVIAVGKHIAWVAQQEAIAYAQHTLGATNIDDLIREAVEHSRGTTADFATTLRRLAERRARA